MTLASGDILVYDGNNWVNSSYTGYTKVVPGRPGPPTQSNGPLNLGDGPFDTGRSLTLGENVEAGAWPSGPCRSLVRSAHEKDLFGSSSYQPHIWWSVAIGTLSLAGRRVRGLLSRMREPWV